MHIRALVLGCVAAMAILALAPVSMAGPAPDICVLDLSQPASVDCVAPSTADLASAVVVADVFVDPVSTRGASGDAARPDCNITHATFDFAGHRLHEDPGRCLV